jgi:hypothetical protein
MPTEEIHEDLWPYETCTSDPRVGPHEHYTSNNSKNRFTQSIKYNTHTHTCAVSSHHQNLVCFQSDLLHCEALQMHHLYLHASDVYCWAEGPGEGY